MKLHAHMLQGLGSLDEGDVCASQVGFVRLSWCGVQDAIISYIPSAAQYIDPTDIPDPKMFTFAAWASQAGYCLDWRMSLYFYKFLSETLQSSQHDYELLQECMIYAASQWCYFHKGLSQEVRIRTCHLPKLCIIGGRSKHALEERDLFLETTDYKKVNTLFEIEFGHALRKVQTGPEVIQ